LTRLFTRIPVFLFFVLVLFCLLASFTVGIVRAEPFLWCGATPDATKWEINLDGVIIEVKTSHIADETAWLKYDLIGISRGAHFVEVRAGNVWAWSDWYSLVFTRGPAEVLVKPYIDI